MKIIHFLTFLSSLVILSGCNWKNIENTQNISINSENYTLEVARTEEDRAKGLSDRTALGEQTGMIFYYDSVKTLSFWMKDTLIPLQIIFINGCKIIDIQEMEVETNPDKPQKTYQSGEVADKAIELNKGTLPKSIIGQDIEGLCD